MGLGAMILYYRFFHPAGPINPCVGESVDLKYDIDSPNISSRNSKNITNDNVSNHVNRNESSPDFVIEFEETESAEKSRNTPPPVPKRKLQHSRSFKNSCPKTRRSQTQCATIVEDVRPHTSHESVDGNDHSHPFEESPITSKTFVVTDRGGDSAYGTDSNRTASRNNGSPPQTININDIDINEQDEDNHNGTFIQNSSGSSAANQSNSSSSSAFNNDTYMSIDKDHAIGLEYTKHRGEDKCDNVGGHNNTYQSVDVQSPAYYQPSKTRKGDVNCDKTPKSYTYATPSKLLKRSPIVKDVTVAVTSGFAHISPTEKVVQKTNTDTDRKEDIQKPLQASKLSDKKGATKQQKMKENGLNPPLTIIIPNISHRAFASKTNNETKRNSGGNDCRKDYSKHLPLHDRQHSEQFSDRTIPLEILNPSLQNASYNIRQNSSNLASHDYENLALININRGGIGVRHWKTYSDMADDTHDNSVSYERAKQEQLNNTQHSTSSKDRRHADYSSLHYFDIYPLSREMKDQLYRSITPISTAATMASDSQTNITDSDTYEPIETYAINMDHEKVIGTNMSGHHRTYSNGSLGEPKVPVPLTLIHHDGRQVSTRQIVTMDSLKELLGKHEKVPMDDPQDRGDLYLLAPMRLLTPILEETESEMTGGTTTQQSRENDFNRSVITVISEMLTNHSKNMMLYQSILSENQNNQIGSRSQNSTAMQYSTDNDSIAPTDGFGSNPDGQFQDSVDSASSTLVHTIEEIKNQSLCNLYFYSSALVGEGDSNEIRSFNNNGAAPQVPHSSHVPRTELSKNHFIPIKPNQVENDPIMPLKRMQEGTNDSKKMDDPPMKEANTSFSNSSIKSIQSNTLVLTPRKVSDDEKEKKHNQQKIPKKKSPLYTSVGTRKNLFQLTDNSSMKSILNTPGRKNKDTVFTLPASSTLATSDEKTTKLLPSYSGEQDANFLSKVRETLSSDSETDTESQIQDDKVTIKTNSYATAPEHFGNSFLCENRSILSPSSKYNTPTPELRPNQFVRNINPSNRTRRKFSMIREQFESPDIKRKNSDKPRQMITARSNNDLYENISDDFLMLRNSVREKQERISKCKSVPSFVEQTVNGLPPDGKYRQCVLQDENVLRPSELVRNQWSTKSYQNFLEDERYTKQKTTINGAGIGNRNKNYRRSMSILEAEARASSYAGDKENYNPQVSYNKFVKTVNGFTAPPIPQKPLNKRAHSGYDNTNQSLRRLYPNGHSSARKNGVIPTPLSSSSPHNRQNLITKSSDSCYMINTGGLCNPSRTSTLSPKSNVFNASKNYRQSRLI